MTATFGASRNPPARALAAFFLVFLGYLSIEVLPTGTSRSLTVILVVLAAISLLLDMLRTRRTQESLSLGAMVGAASSVLGAGAITASQALVWLLPESPTAYIGPGVIMLYGLLFVLFGTLVYLSDQSDLPAPGRFLVVRRLGWALVGLAAAVMALHVSFQLANLLSLWGR